MEKTINIIINMKNGYFEDNYPFDPNWKYSSEMDYRWSFYFENEYAAQKFIKQLNDKNKTKVWYNKHTWLSKENIKSYTIRKWNFLEMKWK